MRERNNKKKNSNFKIFIFVIRVRKGGKKGRKNKRKKSAGMERKNVKEHGENVMKCV